MLFLFINLIKKDPIKLGRIVNSRGKIKEKINK